jgi:hypothetical protein
VSCTTEELLERSRRERERSRQLRKQLRATLAQTLVLLWHSRRVAARPGRAAELAARAERAKRNRETVVRTPRGLPPPPHPER